MQTNFFPSNPEKQKGRIQKQLQKELSSVITGEIIENKLLLQDPSPSTFSTVTNEINGREVVPQNAFVFDLPMKDGVGHFFVALYNNMIVEVAYSMSFKLKKPVHVFSQAYEQGSLFSVEKPGYEFEEPSSSAFKIAAQCNTTIPLKESLNKLLSAQYFWKGKMVALIPSFSIQPTKESHLLQVITLPKNSGMGVVSFRGIALLQFLQQLQQCIS